MSTAKGLFIARPLEPKAREWMGVRKIKIKDIKDKGIRKIKIKE